MLRHHLRLSRLYSTSTQRIRAQARIQEVDRKSPVAPSLIDTFHRGHDYLRISLTERCNLRCFYCMPSEGIELSPKSHILSDDEVIRLASLFVRNGVTKIRLTGGEPTIRKNIVELIARLNALRDHGLKSIAMTSNGLALHRKLPDFIKNGLTHLNLSLDTLDPFKFELMTRRPGHEAVMKTLNVALASKQIESVKLNVVVIKGMNDHEILDFVEMTRNSPISVRFIEFMPFTGNKWDKAKMVPSSDLIVKIAEKYPDLRKAPSELNETARSWHIPGFSGSFGFISSMSDHFCSSCNRLRLTADGQIKVCLFDSKEISLRDYMRNGASDKDLLEIIGLAVKGKKEKHAGMENIDVVTNRPMILIGGASPRRRSRRNIFPLPAATMQHLRAYSTKLTHIGADGRPNMVNVGDKQITMRSATAFGRVKIPYHAFELIKGAPSSTVAGDKARAKGDVLTVAQLAGIMGAKKTSELIPLCHPINLSHVSVELKLSESPDAYSVDITAIARCEGKTGVEMEALTAVSVAALTVWDMLKAVAGKEMIIRDIAVIQKDGGRSGDFRRILFDESR